MTWVVNVGDGGCHGWGVFVTFLFKTYFQNNVNIMNLTEWELSLLMKK